MVNMETEKQLYCSPGSCPDFLWERDFDLRRAYCGYGGEGAVLLPEEFDGPTPPGCPRTKEDA